MYTFGDVRTCPLLLVMQEIKLPVVVLVGGDFGLLAFQLSHLVTAFCALSVAKTKAFVLYIYMHCH